MSEEKKLSIDYVEEVANQYEEQKEVTIKLLTKNGYEDATITIDRYFSPSKIKVCIKEFTAKLDSLKIYIRENDEIEEVIQCWFIMILIKHFSSLDIPNDFKRQIAVLDRLISTTVLFQIFAEFDSVEVEKVMIYLNEAVNQLLEHFEKFEEEYDKINFLDSLSKKKIESIIEGK